MPRDLKTDDGAIKRIARCSIGGIGAIIVIALFWGRQLERSYPELITAVGFLGLVLAVAILSLAVRVYWNRPHRPSFKASLIDSLPILTSIVLAIGACETLILLPIERIHFLKYAALSGLIPIAANGILERSPRSLLIGFLVAASVGSLEEGTQAFVPERFFDLRDIGLNVTGALFGTVISWLLPRPHGT